VRAQEFAAGRRECRRSCPLPPQKPFQIVNAMKNHGVSAQPGAAQRTTSVQQEAESHTELDVRLPQGQMPNVGSREIGVNIRSWVGVFFFVVLCFSFDKN
jgi:hypothetical protein